MFRQTTQSNLPVILKVWRVQCPVRRKTVQDINIFNDTREKTFESGLLVSGAHYFKTNVF